MAATADFTLKAFDTLPSIQAVLTSNGTAVNLTGATVKFIMRAADGGFNPTSGASAVKVNTVAVIADALNGVVRYDWATGDTSSPGNYVAEWQCTFAGGKVETFPTLTFHAIQIVADLDGGI